MSEAAEMLATLERMRMGRNLVDVSGHPSGWKVAWIKDGLMYFAKAKTLPEAVAACWAKGAK